MRVLSKRKIFCDVKRSRSNSKPSSLLIILQIYETETLKVNQKFSFIDFISHFEWSPDSTLLLVGLFKRGICEVKSLDNPDWVCKIDEVCLIKIITFRDWPE